MFSTRSYDESELHLRFKEGSEAAAAQLYRKYYRGLVFFAMDFVKEQKQAEDIVQDAFVKLWQNRNKFQTLPELRSYLYVTVRNAALNLLEHENVKNRFRNEAIHTQVREDDLVESRMLLAELMQFVYQHLKELPAPYAEVLQLLYLEELSPAEVAERLQLSPENLRIRKFRAIGMLRAILLKKGISSLSLFFLYFFVTKS